MTREAFCTENSDGSLSIKIDGMLAKAIGFRDQMIVEVSFDENGDLIVSPYREPVEKKEMQKLIEKLIKKYKNTLENLGD